MKSKGDNVLKVVSFLCGYVPRLARVRWLAAVLLAVAVLAPYHQVVTGRAIPIPDDIFVSDLADGEFPGRVEAGRILRECEWPVWTPRVMTGMPLILDPFTVVLFASLPPAQALGALWSVFLLAAALGTYALARRLGTSRAGAFLAGFAFAWSGFFVCQLRHLGVIGTVAFFPWALYCLERASSRGLLPRERFVWLAVFSGCFGVQLLSGFPQSAYISALFYAALVAMRACGLLYDGRRLPRRERVMPAALLCVGALGAVVVGSLIGMSVLMPLKELGNISDRSGGGTYEWATYFKYYLPNFFTFFVPYINGDISDMSYRHRSIFWEDYGYVGLVTVMCAMAAVAGWFWRAAKTRSVSLSRRGLAVVFWATVGVLAYLLVLGSSTPIYRIAYECLPGLKTFRFPTRFLFVVELALALLGGLGVTSLQAAVARREPRDRRKTVAVGLGIALACITACDLVWYNRRQNPLVDSGRWLTPPASVSVVQGDSRAGRVYAPSAIEQHKAAFFEAYGWAEDLTPYVVQRDLLQPNSNLLHGVPTLNAYAGISPSWAVDLIGDHNRHGLIEALCEPRPGEFYASSAYYDWLEVCAVRWLFLPSPVLSDRLERVKGMPKFTIYRLKGTLPRARFVSQVRLVRTPKEAQRLAVAGTLDLRQESILHRADDVRCVETALSAGGKRGGGKAQIVVDKATEVVVETESEAAGLFVLADMFYPGWVAWVDGVAHPILRVNFTQRGVVVPGGAHRVVFKFCSQAVQRGLLLSVIGFALSVGTLGALLLKRRMGR